MKHALYARVSTKDQFCEQQIADLRAFAAQQGWSDVEEYIDHGVSGKKDSRPALDRLMAACRRGEVATVCVVRVDRWGRSMQHLVTSIQQLTSLGVQFIATQQGLDLSADRNNAVSRLMLNLLSAFADFERSLISERTCSGLARARANGRVGGKPRAAFDEHQAAVLLGAGLSMAEVGRHSGCDAATISRRRLKPVVLTTTGAEVMSALQGLGASRSEAARLVAACDQSLGFDEMLRTALGARSRAA